MEELAEAQKRTEQRVARGEERLSRVEKALAELAEAQKRTEQHLAELAEHVEELHERVEGISHSVGYSLENRAYLALPHILAREHNIQVDGDLKRRYLSVGGKLRQVNIFGYGRKGEERVLLVGEAKVRPSRRDVFRLRKLCQQLAEEEGLPAVPLLVAHDFLPEVEELLAEQGFIAVWSYHVDRVLYERWGGPSVI